MAKTNHSETDIHDEIDNLMKDKQRQQQKPADVAPDIFSETPMELKKVNENLTFIEKIRKNLPKKKEVYVDVFGVEKVSLESILMLNIWDRSILTYDAVSKLVLKMTLEQLKKYIPKKTGKGFEYWWLILLIIIGGIAIALVVLFLLPRLSGIKLF